MSIIRVRPYRRRMTFTLLIAVVLIGAQTSIAETPEEAIRRIQGGRHTSMPLPSTAPASGPAGKGMTIENGTGQTLYVHFNGPVSRTVVVPDGRSENVELVVGDYQVAAEVPGSKILPFFGHQTYQPLTHYWLKFYTEKRPSSEPPSSRPSGPHGAIAAPKSGANVDLHYEVRKTQQNQIWELYVESMERNTGRSQDDKDTFWTVHLRLKNHHTHSARFSTKAFDPNSFEVTCESATGDKVRAHAAGFIFKGEMKLPGHLTHNMEPQQELELGIIFPCFTELKVANLEFLGLTLVLLDSTR